MDAYLLRIDLSHSSRDYDPTALEPGVPFCDRSGGNYAILRRWLGTSIAEPMWNGEELQFYARAEDGARLTQAVCSPLTSADVTGPLKAQADQFVAAVKNVRPITSTERMLHRAIVRAATELTNEDRGMDNGFWKVREGSGGWRLVWCWGYRRKYSQPAAEVICSNPECRQLFVRSPGAKDRCPRCSSSVGAGTPRQRGIWKTALFATAALLVLTAGLIVAGWTSIHWKPLHQMLAAIPYPLTKQTDSIRPIVSHDDSPSDRSISRPPTRVEPDSDYLAADAEATSHNLARESGSVGDAPEKSAANLTQGVNDKGDAIKSAPPASSAAASSPQKQAVDMAAQPIAKANAVAQPLDRAVGRASAIVPASNASPAVARTGALLPLGTTPDRAFNVRNGVVSVGDVPAHSVFHRAHLTSGTVLTSINGTPLMGRSPAAVYSYFHDHPLAVGDVVGYRGIDGALGEAVLTGAEPSIDGRALREVRLLDVRVANLSAEAFQAVLDLELTVEADYRLVDRSGNGLGNWLTLPASASATLTSNSIARTVGDDYELFVERRSGDAHKLFQVAFKLTGTTH